MVLLILRLLSLCAIAASQKDAGRQPGDTVLTVENAEGELKNVQQGHIDQLSEDSKAVLISMGLSLGSSEKVSREEAIPTSRKTPARRVSRTEAWDELFRVVDEHHYPATEARVAGDPYELEERYPAPQRDEETEDPKPSPRKSTTSKVSGRARRSLSKLMRQEHQGTLEVEADAKGAAHKVHKNQGGIMEEEDDEDDKSASLLAESATEGEKALIRTRLQRLKRLKARSNYTNKAYRMDASLARKGFFWDRRRRDRRRYCNYCCRMGKADCLWETWSGWDPPVCPVTCGSGVWRKTRKMVHWNRCGGRPCDDPYLSKVDAACNHFPCPIDCRWAGWGAWTPCTKSCDSGTQQRTRVKIHSTEHGGRPCPGDYQETIACETWSCPIDCEFSEWKEWGNCTEECGGGERTRSHYLRWYGR